MEWHSGAAPVVLNQVLKKRFVLVDLYITPSEISDLDAARHFKHDMARLKSCQVQMTWPVHLNLYNA